MKVSGWCLASVYHSEDPDLVSGRAGGSTKFAKVLAFASFGLQILESVDYVDMSCNVFTS